MGKGTTGSQKKVVKVGIDILNDRMLRIATAFKNFLTEHQAVVAKQEAKRSKLMGQSTVSNKSQSSPMKPKGSSLDNKRKLKILPIHQQAQYSRPQDNGLSGEDPASML
jgi:hypothetical protein